MTESERARQAMGLPPLVGRTYKVLERLGSGGMGSVHLARDLGLERLVALKTLPIDAGADPSTVEAFRREGAMLARVRSPWVVQVLAFDGSVPYLVMEYVDGVSLRALMIEHATRGAPVPVPRALTLVRQIAQGLGDLHLAGVVHRDVKPANVVVERGSSRPVIIDLGLATPAGIDDRTVRSGTPRYMPPELARGDLSPISTPTMDVYSLACVAFELLTGVPPYDAERVDELLEAHVSAPVPRLADRRRELAPLDDVMSRALSKKVADRPGDGHAFARAIMDASASLGRKTRDDDTHTGTPSGSVAIDGLSILIVDDDAVMRRFASRCAQIAAYGTTAEVRAVGTAAEALEIASQRTPNLLVLDHLLAGTTGAELLTKLRALPGAGSMRVLVLSGTHEDELRRSYDALGVTGLIRKPFSFEQLVGAIQAICVSSGWVVERPA